MKPISEYTQRARDLRKKQTSEEELLWMNLRSRKFRGKKFLRQHSLIYQIDTKPRYFIADFYCAAHRLVVELDGGYHETPTQQEYDQWRDAIIEGLKLKILRIKNEEMKDVEKVLKKIEELFSLTPANNGVFMSPCL